MRFPQIKSATLLKRYKRFLADVLLADGSMMTIYVPNTGAMTNCGSPGDTIWYSTVNNPKRKYQHTWELSEVNGSLVCVNTAQANKLVAEALQNQQIAELAHYQQQRAEVRYGENSRIDFLLSKPSPTEGTEPLCYLEVKSCTLLEAERGPGRGFFPDAVSKRGQKHLQELIKMRQQGHRAVLLFAVLHNGIDSVSAARHIDPSYASWLAEAQQQGVELLAYGAELSQQGMRLSRPLSVIS